MIEWMYVYIMHVIDIAMDLCVHVKILFEDIK